MCVFLFLSYKNISRTRRAEARDVTVTDVLLVGASAAVEVKSTVCCFVSSFPAGENGNSQHRTDAVNTTHQKRAERDSRRRGRREAVMEGGVGDS